MRPLGAIVLVFALVACASGPGEAEVIAAVTDGAIVPALERAAADAMSLSTAVDDFCVSPDAAKQETAQEAWLRAEISWETAELATWYGPGHMSRTVAKVDYEPVGTDGIDELLASDTSIDLDYVDNRAASPRRGLGAVEYLIFSGLEEAAAERSCDLATASAAVIATETAALADAWVSSYEDDGPYRETFTETMTTNAALGDLVASMVETLKKQARFELGRALGITAQEGDPEAIPEGRAGAGADRYVAQLEGLRAQLTAGGESSLGALLAARSEQVADRVDLLLEEALSEVGAIDEPLFDLVQSDPGRLIAIQETLAELVTVFEADVVSTLDITLGFSDTDGDSG